MQTNNCIFKCLEGGALLMCNLKHNFVELLVVKLFTYCVHLNDKIYSLTMNELKVVFNFEVNYGEGNCSQREVKCILTQKPVC